MQSKELNAKAIHDALGEGEFCDVCTHLSAEQMDEIYERQEEEIRQLTEHNENLQKALDTLLNGLPGRG